LNRRTRPVRLGEVLERVIDHRGRTPKKLGGDFCPLGIQVLSAKSIRDGTIHLDDEQRFISEQMWHRWMPEKLRPGDILLTSEAPLGEVALIPSEWRYCLGQRLFALRADAQRLDNRFLFYVLRSPDGQQRLRARETGTTAQGIRQSELLKVEIDLPPIEDQRRISLVLGLLDDRIELNRQMRQTMEAMARTLFKSWFVDFDPVLALADGRPTSCVRGEDASLFPTHFRDTDYGRVPDGWTMGLVGELLELDRAGIEPFVYPDEVFAHYSIPAYDQGAGPALERGALIRSNKHLVPDGAVLLSKLNPEIVRVWLPEGNLDHRRVCSTEFLVCRPRDRAAPEYLYCLFLDADFRGEFASRVTGTSKSHQRVRPEDLVSMGTLLPSAQVVRLFAERVHPWFVRIESARRESRILAELRDSLLTRLLSGEVQIDQADDLVTQAV
jgi:type I restriction enzyme, S subunit